MIKDKEMLELGLKILVIPIVLFLLRFYKIDQVLIEYIEPVGIKAGRMMLGIVWLVTRYIVIGLFAVIGLFVLSLSLVEKK